MSEVAAGCGYARSEVLVTTGWLADRRDAPGLRFVETDEDPLVDPSAPMPGAIEIVERVVGRELSLGKSRGLTARVQCVRRKARRHLVEVAAHR